MTSPVSPRGVSVRWYLLGILTAVAIAWISRGSPQPAPAGAGEAAPEPAPSFSSEAIELVRTARAREGDGDSAGARSAYLQAAAQLTPIGDYLRLRAAQITADSAARNLLYQGISTSPAREHFRLVEARMLERTGDLAAAALARRELGQPGESFRLRLAAAGTAAARVPILRELVLRAADSASGSRPAVAVAAMPYLAELGKGDLLDLARASGDGAAAVSFYERASARGARLTPDDFASWGEALFARSRYPEAAARLRRVTSGPRLPRSLLLRGRAMLRAGQSGGRAVLETLVRRFPGDSSSTPTALTLLGDIARDAGDYASARRHWAEVAERFSRSPEAPRARFLVGLVQYTGGEKFAAAETWDSLFHGEHGNEEALSGGYWAGRAYQESGDTARARARWREVIGRSRLSYYSRLSWQRLGLVDSTLSAGEDDFASSPWLEAARQRLHLLAATGLASEHATEVTWLAGQAGTDLTTVLGTASLLRSHFRATQSAQLGWRALDAGAAEARTYRLIFPLLFEQPLVSASRARELDPALTAALIRQESLFDSMATSRAGARGLMQLMPSVGRELARSARLPWHVDSLYRPGLNLELGTAHLAWALGRYGGLERTLAAYNAGGSRVTRWARYPGTGDPEVFVEWIPFPETRSYVRTVMRNLEFYRALYSWECCR